jgi:hypothetical protein
MTIATPEEYVTDVPYVRAFVGDLSPLALRLVAAMNGFPVPQGDRFHYCELGCAHGDTTATLAAAYPASDFVGIDINPDHIASANRLASLGELDNVRFLERSFEDLAKRGCRTSTSSRRTASSAGSRRACGARCSTSRPPS